VRITKSRSDWMSKPLSAMHHVADMILVPGEDSSTGNVTGERKLARHDLQAAHLSTSCLARSLRLLLGVQGSRKLPARLAVSSTTDFQ
jgi:hypothetical protein